MPTSWSHRARFKLALAALAGVSLVILLFWAFELRQTLISFAEREQEILQRHQEKQLEAKAVGIQDLFDEMYQNARTISLLPAIRGVSGGNRTSENEDPVTQGRLSEDTHRTLQQLYKNLHTYIRVSEIYYVLDGFDPARGEVPFFMYDDQIVGKGVADHATPVRERHSIEDESFEYAYLVKQLEMFRQQAPVFRFDRALNEIPALISPLLRTCDNAQFPTEASNSRDNEGFIFSVPVYDLETGQFKGLIATIVRANQLEARLLGLPFLPLFEKDRVRAQAEGLKVPEESAPFVLTEQVHRIEIADRRQPLFRAGLSAAKAKGDGRWAEMKLMVPGNGFWTLSHYLGPAEADALLMELETKKRFDLAGRVVLLVVLYGMLGWGVWLFFRSRRELIWLAHYDSLTELPNRRLFFDRLQSGLARAKRTNTRLALFYVDVADLNAVNDAYGHHAGDRLLIELSERFRQHLRGGDAVFRGQIHDIMGSADALPVVSRLGGDEFTILCEDIKTADGLGAIADRILGAVAEPFVCDGNSVDVHLNIGVAVYPDDSDDAENGERLLMCADTAMNECKKHRQGGYVLFNEKTRVAVERQHMLALELQSALAHEAFTLHYQPKASLRDGGVSSMEALLRWKHSTLGPVSPVEFIPILERSGAIIDVGQWVIEQACRDMLRLNEAGYPELHIAVNVSIRQLRRGNLHETVAVILDRFGIAPGRLILEITESLVMEDMEQGRLSLLKLRELGVGLAIDDFGTGYSSLTYLQNLPVSSLKIDKGLIDGMVDDRSGSVVDAVIRLSKGLHLKTVAEGIETEQQRDQLAAMGCDLMQGFLLSKPRPLEEIIEWLNQRQRHRS